MSNAEMFLTVQGSRTGAILGESDAPDHLEAIEVTGWSWGMTGSSAMGGSGATVRTALTELKVTKQTDRASTHLMSVMRNNEVLNEVKLFVRKAGVTPPMDQITITILKGRITSFSIGNEATGSANLVETLSFAFEEIEVAYASQDSSGAGSAQSMFCTQVHSS